MLDAFSSSSVRSMTPLGSAPVLLLLSVVAVEAPLTLLPLALFGNWSLASACDSRVNDGAAEVS